MDNTMRIAIPWKPGMTVMLKDGRVVTGAWIIFVEGEHDFRNPGKHRMSERQAEELVRNLHEN